MVKRVMLVMQTAVHRIKLQLSALSLALMLSSGPACADEPPEKERLLPFYDDWFVEQGIELPLPLGTGLALIYMDRDVEVDDVRVSFGGRPPESIADNTDFGVSNSTSLYTARADAWVLPFLNVYLMAGYTDGGGKKGAQRPGSGTQL